MKMKCPLCGVSGSVSDSLLGKKVRCPKCKEVFKVTAEKAFPAPQKEPRKEPVIQASGHVADTAPAPGMTAQDEAALEKEIAKIFDDMKSSAMDHDLGSELGSRTSDYGNDKMNPPMTTKDKRIDVSHAETESISEEGLKSELEEMLGKKCSVCGTFVGQSTKHEIGGNVYCSVCLPESGGAGSDASTGKDLAVSMGPDLKKALTGFWKTKGVRLVGILAIALTLVALFYQLFMKRN